MFSTLSFRDDDPRYHNLTAFAVVVEHDEPLEAGLEVTIVHHDAGEPRYNSDGGDEYWPTRVANGHNDAWRVFLHCHPFIGHTMTVVS